MKKLLTLLLTAMVALSFTASFANADSTKGQKLFIKKLKKPCEMTGGDMAKKLTQIEWKTANSEGKLMEKIAEFCPEGADLEGVKDKYLPHIYDFLFNYASDSGNVPSC